jgi:hypothetical protein
MTRKCVSAHLRSAWQQKPGVIHRYAKDTILKKIVPTCSFAYSRICRWAKKITALSGMRFYLWVVQMWSYIVSFLSEFIRWVQNHHVVCNRQVEIVSLLPQTESLTKNHDYRSGVWVMNSKCSHVIGLCPPHTEYWILSVEYTFGSSHWYIKVERQILCLSWCPCICITQCM